MAKQPEVKIYKEYQEEFKFPGRNQDRQEFKVVGRKDIRIPGAISYAIATGAAKFSNEVVIPGMLHGKVLRSPYAHARIKSMDTSKAEALPGVKAVITWEDEELQAMGINIGPILVPTGFSSVFPTAGVPLLGNEAFREGDEVGVMLVAESEELCDQAMKLIAIDWEVLPHAVDTMDAIDPNTPILHPELSPDSNCTGEWSGGDGDVEAGFHEADHIIEYDHSYGSINNHKSNNLTYVAWWERDPIAGGDKLLYIEGSGYHYVLPWVRKAFNLPENKVRWLTIMDGPQYCDMRPRRIAILTPLLAKRTGRPVRMAYTRRDSFDAGGGDSAYVHMKVGVKKDGTITAIHWQDVCNSGIPVLSDEGGIAKWGAITFKGDIPIGGGLRLTKCENILMEHKYVPTNTVQQGAGQSIGPWELTGVIWMVADKLGIDPTEVALKNAHTPEPSLKECIEKGKEAIDWDEKFHAPGTKRLPNGKMHGFAFNFHDSGRHSHANYTCCINIKADGKVYVPYRGPIRGVFCEDACALVIAEELGARPEDVIVQFSHEAPGTVIGGGADGGAASTWVAKEAAIDAKALLLKEASRRLKVPVGELDTKDSRVYLKSDPEQNYSFGLFVYEYVNGWPRDLSVAYSGRPPLSVFATPAYCGIERFKIIDTVNAKFCEVEVDSETGEVEITRWVGACDVGKAIRPSSVEGQIEQQFIVNSGCSKMEEFVWDKATGVLLNGSDLEYKIPTILDTPPIDPIIVETRTGNGCYGASGVYHSIVDMTIVNLAVYNAIGKWVGDTPVTPDKVLKALGKI